MRSIRSRSKMKKHSLINGSNKEKRKALVSKKGSLAEKKMQAKRS